MTVEFVIGLGLVGLLAVAIWTVFSIRAAFRTEQAARLDLAHTEKTGALPPSLYPRVDLDRCMGAGACVEVCPEKDVLAVLDGKAVIVNPSSCIGHGECLRACPVDAIQLVIGHERRGVDIPLLSKDFETNVPGLFIVGELGGMGLIYNAMTQGMQGMRTIASKPPPKTAGVHQVVIVGAGPAGIAASLVALEAGLDFVTLDQESIGGTVAQYPRHKLVMTKPVTLPLYGKLKVNDIRKEALIAHWQDIIEKTGLTVQEKTRVTSVTPTDSGLFDIKTSAGELKAHRVVLALGRRGSPRKMKIPGESLPKVCYRLVDAEQYQGQRVLVVGGGDSAVEAAIACGEAGATTHLCYRKGSFSRIKKKNSKRLDEAVEAGRVSLLLHANPKEVLPDRVIVDVGGERTELPNDFVIVAIGGVLPTKFLAAAGVEVRSFKGEIFEPANT